jgi:hypothetical protein
MSRFALVVSAENHPYLVWQAMLFHYSCMTRTGSPPVIVVHKGDEPLLEGFSRIAERGGIIQTAPNYRWAEGVHYPPRNTAATLLHVETDAEYIVLCDPDMIFISPQPLVEHQLEDDQVSFDRLTYLDPQREQFPAMLAHVCPRVGVSEEILHARPINGGVPHIVPRSLARPLAREWLEVMRSFPREIGEHVVKDNIPEINWMSTMWAVVLAVHRLNLRPVMTGFCETNWNDHRPLAEVVAAGYSMIHYCYPEPGFNKHLRDQPDNWSGVWSVPAGDETLGGEIRRQLHEARLWFGWP